MDIDFVNLQIKNTFPIAPFSNAGIPLITTRRWGQFEATPVTSADDGRGKAAKIFDFFIAAGREGGLGETPCVKMLEDALTLCNNTATQNLTEIAKANKIVQKTRSMTPLYTSILQGYVVEQIPIFNIFE